MKNSFFHNVAMLAAAISLAACGTGTGRIDRHALVTRNNPRVDRIDPLHSLNIGNGEFTMTLDATGLQTFPEFYRDGLSLGTYSEWGWHSFPNTEGYSYEQTLEDHPLPGHPHGLYAVQAGNSRPERNRAAAEYLRANPHRLHLGNIGFAGMKTEDISEVDQVLDMWDGMLHSSFKWKGMPVKVRTVSGGEGSDMIAASVEAETPLPVTIRFPYPSGGHTDDGSDWNSDERHSTETLSRDGNGAILKRTIDGTVYYVRVHWDGKAAMEQNGRNAFVISPAQGTWSFSVEFSGDMPQGGASDFGTAALSAREMWNGYWKTTGIIDFSHCTDERAPLLERRVILSQYLMRVQQAQNFPPAETGMTYNSWYGKFHLEMVMWHSFHYATWNKEELLEKQLDWYRTAFPKAREIARRQGFDGVRWMKMTDPSALEAASDIGSFIIWQQPHPIYMAELIYRADPKDETIDKYYEIVQESARFMADFLSYDAARDRFIIEGACAANESLNEQKTVNPAFELSYWHFGLGVAQAWRERKGEERVAAWDEILDKLSPLAASPEGIYLPAEKGPGIPDFENGTVEITVASDFSAPAGGFVNAQRPKTVTRTVRIEDADKRHTYIRGTSSENLLAYGMLPACRLFTEENMQKTVERAAQNWGWKGGSWSWNYPSFAMNATRLYRSDIAIRAITMDNRSELLLPSGNNYRSQTLRMYLPGNGGLLLAVGMMCAGWDGCEVENPGFPKDGTWDVRWEDIKPLP